MLTCSASAFLLVIQKGSDDVLLNIEELKKQIGVEIGGSDWFLISQDKIDLFADVTNDHQFIHTDPEKAALTPFGSTVAHGFLSLSMLSYFAETGFALDVENSKMALNYGFDKVRFISPVKVNDKIRGRATLLSVEEKNAKQLLIKQRVIVDIENGDKPALLADWLTMYVY